MIINLLLLMLFININSYSMTYEKYNEFNHGLHEAVCNNDTEKVEAILQGVAYDELRYTKTYYLKFHHITPEVAQALIAHGADIDGNPEEDVLPVRDVSSEVLALILTLGANPNGKGLFGDTALYDATERNDVERIRLLLAHGARPDIEGGIHHNSAMAMAKENGNQEIVTLFAQQQKILLLRKKIKPKNY